MSQERAKPFVAWMDPMATGIRRKGDTRHGVVDYIKYNQDDRATVPVVVTPLLPDDPRPGETWITDGEPCTILSAPYVAANHAGVVVSTQAWTAMRVPLCDLRRPPVLKTFRVSLGATVGAGGGLPIYREIKAESREAAIAKLAESLEEVEP